MVALPWGSRSISSTRRLVATSDAARLMHVVVLPTPPFWLAIANTLAMFFVPLDRAGQYQQMALTLATGNPEHVRGTETKVRRQGLQLVIRVHPFHGQPVGMFSPEMTRPAAEILEAAEGPRADTIERPLWLVALDPAVDNVQIGEFQLQLYLDEKTGLLAVGVEQGKTPFGEHDRQRYAGHAA